MLLLGKAEGILLLSAASQDLPRFEREENRVRGITPGPSDDLGSPLLYQANTIVILGIDVPVVEQEIISDIPQSSQGFIVILGYRLFTKVAASHDQREAGRLQQEVVQRCVGQHHPQVLVSRSHPSANRGLLFPPEEHNGRLWRQ
jgi:hypothetical protein